MREVDAPYFAEDTKLLLRAAAEELFTKLDHFGAFGFISTDARAEKIDVIYDHLRDMMMRIGDREMIHHL